MSKISFCIPWYDGGCARRTEIFNLLVDYYTNIVSPVFDGEVVVAGEDCVNNRSAARNACCKKATGDILFFVDADCHLSIDSIRVAIEMIADKSVGMVQYQRVNWIREILTQEILRDKDLSKICLQPDHGDVLWGLVYVVRRDDYLNINGFNEQFYMWAEEDPAFQIAIETLVGRIARVPNKFYASHLEHPRGQEHSIHSESFKRNRSLCNRYRANKGNVQAIRQLQGLPVEIILDGLVDVYATEEHFAEHMAPVFCELHRRGFAGHFYLTSEALKGVQGVLKQNSFPMHSIHIVDTLASAVYEMSRRRGAILCSGAGDMRDIEKCGRPVILMEHGAGQSYSTDHASYIGGKWREKCALIIVPRDECKEKSLQKYPYINTVAAGCPKLDWYTGKEGKGKVCISFHWDSKFAPESVWAFPEYKNVLGKLKKFLTERGVELIGHCHPRARQQVYPVYRNLGIRIVEKFYDVCDEADVYICDNSSTIFESAAIGKKVILLNSKKYRKDVEHGLRFWSKAGVGVQVDTADTLIDIVGQVLDNKVAIDSSIITTVYNNIGNASKVVVDAILSTPACWGVSEVNDGKITVVANVQFCHTGVLLNVGDEIRVTEKEAMRLGRTYKRGVPMASVKPQKQAVVIAGNLEMTAPVEASAEIIVSSAPAEADDAPTEAVEEKVDDVDNIDSDNAGDDAPAAPKKSSPRKKK